MPEFSPGLEGVVAAETEISEVDGKNGRLIYRGGYLILDLATTCTFEEVAFLLWNGKLPDRAELDDLKRQLADQRSLSESGRATLEAAPRDADPKDVLRTVLSAVAQKPQLTKPSLEEAIHYSAVVPTITAGFYRLQHGQKVVEPKSDLGHAANFLYMMFGEEPAADRAHWIDQYLLLLADHGLNASTFTTRVVASTGSDLGSALVGGIAALKGPAHGGAATGAMKMLEKIGSPENAESWLKTTLEKHERFSGFGHRVYRTYDPRAKILREMAKEANPELYPTAETTEEVALRLLKEKHPERPNQTNVDYWSSVVMAGAGIPKEYFTCVFAVSRVVGWSAHVLELLKDLRIIRPASVWKGPEPKAKPVPLDRRNHG